jgi:hypothetical protein
MDKKAHPGPVAAAHVNACRPGADTGFFGQIHRRSKTADVNLLSHNQLPKLPFRTAVNGLDITQAYIVNALHYKAPSAGSFFHPIKKAGKRIISVPADIRGYFSFLK